VGFSRIASIEEVKDEDCNLNAGLYVYPDVEGVKMGLRGFEEFREIEEDGLGEVLGCV